MRPLEKHILRKLRETGLPVAAGDRLVVGVSGGADSVTLLHLLAALTEQLQFSLCAVYVDHGLRTDEAQTEKEFVEKLSGRLGASFRTARLPVGEYAGEHGLSLEAAARELRYRFLEQVAEELDASAIAVAHTADDQAEELLLRLIRGTGRRGLSGMAPANYRRVVRPLLEVSKTELIAYLRERAIPYLEDSSNLERDFLRNRVRLDLLPYLEKNFNPAVRRNLLRTAEILGPEDELLADLAGDLYRRAVEVREEPDIFAVDVGELATGHLALQRRVLEKLLTELGVKATFPHIEKMLELAARDIPGGELHLAEGLRVVRGGDSLEFSYPAGRNRHRVGLTKSRELSFEKVIEGEGRRPIDELGVDLLIEVLDEPPSREELVSKEADYLDMAGLEFPLTVRSLRPGDRFYPLGGPGSRKVADFLSDRKIAREERVRLPILARDQEIVALLGLRVDQRHRLMDNTRKVLKISLIPR